MELIRLIGVPMDLGADRRGVDMGPSAIRYASVTKKLKDLGHQVIDSGNLSIRTLGDSTLDLSSVAISKFGHHIKFEEEIAEACEELSKHVELALLKNEFPLVIGGDHSIAMGTLAGIAKHHSQKIGVIWFDAHGDLNTPDTTPSGNIHGMSLAVALGRGSGRLMRMFEHQAVIRPENVVIIGARDLDPGEKELIKDLGITVFTMHDIDRLGINNVMERAIKIVSKETKWVHLSLDVDGVDPQFAPGVGTPVPGGLSFRESNFCMEILAKSGCVRSLDVVEVNPILDKQNRTAELAVSLILALFGDTIL